MLIRDVDQVRGTERDIDWGNGKSYRLITAADNVGYTVCHTVVSAGTTSFLQYRNHIESCYCISGEGWVREVSGERHRIRPGIIYILDDHQPHYLSADEGSDLVLLSIFNPPLVGTEKHDLNDSVASSY